MTFCNPPRLFMVFPAYAEIDQTLNPAGLAKLIGEVSGNWIEAVCIGTGLDRETLDAATSGCASATHGTGD